MTFNPFRLYRRWRRLAAEARQEAAFARRRHGDHAAAELRRKLADPALTSWGRKVVRRAVDLLEKGKEKGGPGGPP